MELIHAPIDEVDIERLKALEALFEHEKELYLAKEKLRVLT